jgi:hypothetical protein
MRCDRSYIGYASGCRCEVCRDGWRVYQRDRRRDQVAGLPRLVPAPETRRHLRRLMTAGYCPTAIAAASGVSRSGVQRILQGRSHQVRRVVADAILAVPLDEVIAEHRVPTPIVLRLMAEMADAGLSQRAQLSGAGLSCKWRARRSVDWDSWRRIATLYELLARRGRVPADVLYEVAR